jgi:hypothetical protein
MVFVKLKNLQNLIEKEGGLDGASLSDNLVDFNHSSKSSVIQFCSELKINRKWLEPLCT